MTSYRDLREEYLTIFKKDVFADKEPIDNYIIFILCSYVKFAFDSKLPSKDLLAKLKSKISNETLLYAIEGYLINKDKSSFKNEALEILKNITSDKKILKALITDIFFEWQIADLHDHTPYIFYDLGLRILNVKKSDVFADFCSGTGNVIYKNDIDCAKIYSYDNDVRHHIVALVRAELDCRDIDVKQKNIINHHDMYDTELVFKEGEDQPTEIDNTIRYDKIFCNYDFGMKVPKNLAILPASCVGVYDKVVPLRHSDWLFNQEAVKLLKKNGKAICFTSARELYSRDSFIARKYFVEKGYVEAVISLNHPDLRDERILVLSHGNTEIRMIDALGYIKLDIPDNYDPQWLGYYLYENPEAIIEQPEFVIRCLDNDIDKQSSSVSLKKIKTYDYSLEPAHYLRDFLDIEKGISLQELSHHITRGSSIAKNEIDKLVTKNETSIRLLKLNNLENGEINEKGLQYLKSISKEQKKYCVKNGDLVISKTGPYFKVALCNISYDTILATNNMYILRFNKPLIPVEFIKIYLMSAKGQLQLRMCCTGSVLPNIPITKLKKIKIPFYSDDEIKKILERHTLLKDTIRKYENDIIRTKYEIADMF